MNFDPLNMFREPAPQVASDSALKKSFQLAVVRHGTCAGIRATALAHPHVPVATLVAVGESLGVNATTIRIQTAKARGTTASATTPVAKVHITNAHHEAAVKEIERCQDIAWDKWNVRPNPEVTWNKRGTTAGTAFGSHLIRLNEHFAVHEGEGYLKTVAHEFAHCVVAARRPLEWAVRRSRSEWSPHGAVWQSVMRAFGYRPDRCHNYKSADLIRRTTRTVPARCACKEHMVTPAMAQKIQNGARYRCRNCRGTLTIVG